MSPVTEEVKPVFELREIGGGFELRGGLLEGPLIYKEERPDPAVHLVGFLSQRWGSELRVFDRAGELIQTRRFEATVFMPGAVGGLAGPRDS